MRKKPYFSIVIPTYNRANDLKFAIYCILRQSFTDYEIVICDNNSQDNTRDIVKAYDDYRIRYVRNKTNIGDKGNYQKAISLAKGRYIFLHGDDDFICMTSSLQDIYNTIVRYSPGYLRVNYLCRTPDKRILFDFVPNREFKKNAQLKPGSINIHTVNFVLNTDAFFITGIVFRNLLPKNISIVYTEPCSWINVLLYCASKGAYFMNDRHVVASWSHWRSDVHGNHVLFDVIDGRLQSENFFRSVKQYLSKDEYDIFQYHELRKLYVCMFPAVKFFTGTNNLLQVAKRIRVLDKQLARSSVFKVYLFMSIVTPRFVLGIMRNYFFFKFTRLNKILLKSNISLKVESLYNEYHQYSL